MIEVKITHRALPGREGEVRDLLDLAAELLQRIGVKDREVLEGPDGVFVDAWRFPTADEWEQVDDLLCKDRKLAAIYALLDEVTDSDSADFQVIEDGLPSEVPRMRLTEEDVLLGSSLAGLQAEDEESD